MCKECVVLGSLIPVFKKNRLNASSLLHYDVDYCSDQLFDLTKIVDEKATDHLQETCNQFRNRTEIDFISLKVKADGSCLTHALSKCMDGTEIYFDILRDDLVKELDQNGEWYKLNTPEGRLVDETEWKDKILKDFIRAAQPTRGEPVNNTRYLGEQMKFITPRSSVYLTQASSP